jgi:hypothetical protein
MDDLVYEKEPRTEDEYLRSVSIFAAEIERRRGELVPLDAALPPEELQRQLALMDSLCGSASSATAISRCRRSNTIEKIWRRAVLPAYVWN